MTNRHQFDWLYHCKKVLRLAMVVRMTLLVVLAPAQFDWECSCSILELSLFLLNPSFSQLLLLLQGNNITLKRRGYLDRCWFQSDRKWEPRIGTNRGLLLSLPVFPQLSFLLLPFGNSRRSKIVYLLIIKTHNFQSIKFDRTTGSFLGCRLLRCTARGCEFYTFPNCYLCCLSW